MGQTLQQLAQTRPAGTVAVSALSPGAGEEILVKTIIISNNSGASSDYSIYHDDNGTTYDDTTRLFGPVTVADKESEVVEVNIMANDATGNIAVQNSVAASLNFTLYGSVFT